MRLKSVEVLQGLDGLCELCSACNQCRWKNMIDYDPELWDRVMNINVKGTWLITKSVYSTFKTIDCWQDY